MLAVAILAAACGDGSPTGPDGGGGGGSQFRATIDGRTWTAAGSTIRVDGVGGNQAIPGSLAIQGSMMHSATDAETIGIVLSFVDGPGTYPLGVNTGTTPGGTATVVRGATSWMTPLNGSAGTVTITSIGGGRVKGTFSFDARRTGGSADDRVQARSGSFDVPISGSYRAPGPTEKGAVVTGTIGGAAWRAATVVSGGSVDGLVTIAASSESHVLAVSVGPVPGPGVFPLSFAAVPISRLQVTAGSVGGPCCWGGAGATGSITVTAVGNGRLVGTFEGTLPVIAGGNATGPLTLSGAFDVPTGGN